MARPRALYSIRHLFQRICVRAASTIEEKSRDNRIAVDRPIPWLAPVTIATEFTGLLL